MSKPFMLLTGRARRDQRACHGRQRGEVVVDEAGPTMAALESCTAPYLLRHTCAAFWATGVSDTSVAHGTPNRSRMAADFPTAAEQRRSRTAGSDACSVCRQYRAPPPALAMDCTRGTKRRRGHDALMLISLHSGRGAAPSRNFDQLPRLDARGLMECQPMTGRNGGSRHTLPHRVDRVDRWVTSPLIRNGPECSCQPVYCAAFV